MEKIKTYGIFLFLLSSVLLNAQSSIEISVCLQPGISHETIDNAVYDANFIPVSFAFRGGIEGACFFDETWGARLGVNWLTIRYHEIGIYTVLPEEGKEFTETTIVNIPIPIYYLSVPVQAVCKLPSNNISINLLAGLQYNVYLGSKDNDLYKAQQYPWYKKGHISSNLGVELHKPITDKLVVSVGLTADIPLSNFLKENDGIAQLNNKSRLWQVFVPLKLTYQFKN